MGPYALPFDPRLALSLATSRLLGYWIRPLTAAFNAWWLSPRSIVEALRSVRCC